LKRSESEDCRAVAWRRRAACRTLGINASSYDSASQSSLAQGESEDCRAVAQRRRASTINCCSELRPGKPAKFHPLRSKDEGCRVVAHRREDGLIRRHERGLRLGKPVLTRTRRKRRLPRRSMAKAGHQSHYCQRCFKLRLGKRAKFDARCEARTKAGFPDNVTVPSNGGRASVHLSWTGTDWIA